MPRYTFSTEDGNRYAVNGPDGSTQEEAQQYLGTLGPDELQKFEIVDATTFERLHLGAAEAGTITGNIGNYVKSHLPAVANRYVWDSEGFRIETAADQYGQDFDSLSPQQRRDRIEEVDQLALEERHQEAIRTSEEMAARGETDYARIGGNVAGALADPVAFVPIAGTAAKVKQAATVGQKVLAGAKVGATTGAVFGGAFGASEELADTGLPTTIDEGVELVKSTGEGAAIGTVGGAVLGPTGVLLSRVPAKVRDKRVQAAVRSPTKANKLMDKYQNQVLIAKAAGTTERPVLGAEAHAIARQKLGMTTDDVYKAAQVSDRTIVTPTTATEAAEELGRRHITANVSHSTPIDFVLRPIDARIKELAPRIYGKMMGMESASMTNMHKYHQQTIPFRDMWRAFSGKAGTSISGRRDRKQLGLALMNKDFKRARSIVGARFGDDGVVKLDQMLNALEELGAEAKEAGMKFDLIDNYFPRAVKDLDGLKEFLGSDPKVRGQLQKAIAKAQKSKGKEADLETAEEIKVINRLLTAKAGGPSKLVGSTKSRRVDEITEDMLKFYDDPITSIDLHIRDVTSAIARRNMFGKHMTDSDDKLELLKTSIGKLLADSDLKAGSKEMKELTSMLSDRFGGGERSGNKTLSNLRQVTSGITLGNPISGLLQLSDIGVTAWVKGLGSTLRGLPRASVETLKGTMGLESSKLNADTMGWTMEMAQELSTQGRASNAVRRFSDGLMRYGGFKLMDRMGKNVTIQASLQRSMKRLKSDKGTQKFLDEWGSVYDGDELKTLMRDLKNGELSDIVKQHIFAEVTQIQPISRSQMPQAYLKHPNGRIMYQFKTWGLKQFDLMRTQVLRNLFSLDPRKQAKGAKEAVLMYTFVGAAGLNAREAQNFILGRDSKVTDAASLSDEAFWAVMGNVLFDRYSLDRILESQDLKGAALNYGAPPSFMIPGEIAINAAAGIMGKDDAWQEALKGTGLGRMINMWFMGGAEEHNKKLAQSKRDKILGRD